MSDIKVGDLVVVVKATPCCGVFKPPMPLFVVAGIRSVRQACRHCGKVRDAYAASRKDDPFMVDVNRLKRIPPLSELEGQKEETKEHA